MKPYGREKHVTQNPRWKTDYHCHSKNHRKLESWWEGICGYLSRTEMKRQWKKKIDEEIDN